MNHSRGSLQYYLIIIAVEIAIVCGLQYGDVNPNHAYRTHNLISFALARYGCMCKLSARSPHRLSSSHRLPPQPFI